MAKVTSKYQVTVPRVIAQQYSIRPGDEIEWIPAGESIRVVAGRKPKLSVDTEERLRLFDQATARLNDQRSHPKRAPKDRGWTREDLYNRGRAD